MTYRTDCHHISLHSSHAVFAQLTLACNYNVSKDSVANLPQLLQKCHRCYNITIRQILHSKLIVNALTVSKTTVSCATISYATIRVLTNFHCAGQHSIVQCSISPGEFVQCSILLCGATQQPVCVVRCSTFLGVRAGGARGASYMYNTPKHFLIIFQVMQKALESSCTSKACFQATNPPDNKTRTPQEAPRALQELFDI